MVGDRNRERMMRLWGARHPAQGPDLCIGDTVEDTTATSVLTVLANLVLISDASPPCERCHSGIQGNEK